MNAPLVKRQINVGRLQKHHRLIMIERITLCMVRERLCVFLYQCDSFHVITIFVNDLLM